MAANRRRPEDESDKLLAAHFADAIDLTTHKRHQDRIRAGLLADIDRRIDYEHDQGPRKQITKALRLPIYCQRLYKTTDAHGKRLANQTFTTGIDINEDEEAILRPAEPFAATTGQNAHVRGPTPASIVGLSERCGNTRPAVERLVLAWHRKDAGSITPAEPFVSVDGQFITKPRRRSRTPLTDKEVDAMRTARAVGISIATIARQFGVHRGTVWEKTRAPARKNSPPAVLPPPKLESRVPTNHGHGSPCPAQRHI